MAIFMTADNNVGRSKERKILQRKKKKKEAKMYELSKTLS